MYEEGLDKITVGFLRDNCVQPLFYMRIPVSNSSPCVLMHEGIFHNNNSNTKPEMYHKNEDHGD